MLCGCFPFKTSVSEEELLRAINSADFQFNDPGTYMYMYMYICACSPHAINSADFQLYDPGTRL